MILSKIAQLIEKIHKRFFLKKRFYNFHLYLHRLSLRGMGILNCDDELEGENVFLKACLGIKSNNNPIIFDVGANIGLYSKKVKSLCDDAKIFAFEPHPKNYRRLLTIKDEFKINTYNLACGEENSKLKLYDFIDNDGSTGASFYKKAINELFKSETVEYDVEVIKIDDFVLENNITQIHLLKIDAEGHELSILKGCKKIITEEKVNYIQFEFNNIHAISRVFFKDFYDILSGYNLYRLLPDGLVKLNDYNPIIHEIFAFQNIVAIRKAIDYKK